ncbi:MAG: hypothetical protein ACK4S4_02925 [Pyrinomonadaceae bacterium]
MKKYLFVLLVAAVAALGAAVDANAATGRGQRVTVQIKRESKAAGGLRIRFLELIEDSRCPVDTQCVWAGNAKIRIQVRGRRGAGVKIFEINSATVPTSVVYDGYEIRFVDLTPHPRSNIRIDPNGYRAVFEVVRRGDR